MMGMKSGKYTLQIAGASEDSPEERWVDSELWTDQV